MARKLRLKNLESCDGVSGGHSIELIAQKGDPRSFDLLSVMGTTPSCDFSFCGIKTHFNLLADAEEKKQGM